MGRQPRRRGMQKKVYKKKINRPVVSQWKYHEKDHQVFHELIPLESQKTLVWNNRLYRDFLVLLSYYRRHVKFTFVPEGPEREQPKIQLIFQDKTAEKAFWHIDTSDPILNELFSLFLDQFISDLLTVSQQGGHNFITKIYAPGFVAKCYNTMFICKVIADLYRKESSKRKSLIVKQIDDFLKGKVNSISEPSLLAELENKIPENDVETLLNNIQRNSSEFIKELNFLLGKEKYGIPSFNTYRPQQNFYNEKKGSGQTIKYVKLEIHYEDQKAKYNYYKQLLDDWKKSEASYLAVYEEPTFSDRNVITISSDESDDEVDITTEDDSIEFHPKMLMDVFVNLVNDHETEVKIAEKVCELESNLLNQVKTDLEPPSEPLNLIENEVLINQKRVCELREMEFRPYLSNSEIKVEPLKDQEPQKDLSFHSLSSISEIILLDTPDNRVSNKRKYQDSEIKNDVRSDVALKKPRYANIRSSLLFKANEKRISNFMTCEEYLKVLDNQREQKSGELKLEEKRCLLTFLLSNDLLAELFNFKFWEILEHFNFLEKSDLKECLENFMKNLKRDIMSELEHVLKGYIDDDTIINIYNLIRTTIFLNCTN